MAAWNVIRKAVVASTMDEINALGEAGAPGRTVVVADEQTAGRGRAGRPWIDQPGSGLFLSILHRPAVDPSRLGPLPLLIGVAVADAVAAVSSVECKLKWPNDLLASGGKIGGILVMTKLAGSSVDFVNIGIGVNCTARQDVLPVGAASIFTESGEAVSPSELLPAVLDQVDRRLAEFELGGGEPGLRDWLLRAAFVGDAVSVVDQGEPREGRFVGVDQDGALLMEDKSGARSRIVSGDLTRGPKPNCF